MRKLIVIAVCLAASPVIARTTATDLPSPSACAGPEFRQLDFWLGDWDAKWGASQGTPAGVGTNHITKSYEECVIEERFDGRPGQHLMGHSVSTYFAPTKQWKQTWVDNEGGYIDLTGGPDGQGNFVLMTVPRPGGHLRRMVFTNIKPNSFTWKWQATNDGKTWTDSWVISYTRKRA